MSALAARRSRRGRSTRLVAIVAACGLLAVAAGLALWGPRGAHAFGERTDPTHAYRVEFLTATNAQRVLHPFMDMPGTARLVRVGDGAVVGSSGVMDFFGGGNADVIWLMAQNRTVQVGRDIVFRDVPSVTSR